MQQELRLKGDDEPSASALDRLFEQVESYRSGENYLELLRFISRFPTYAPFNAFLLHTQKPGSRFVASVEDWARMGRSIKPGARPLVILWPFAPVRYVYELGETEGESPLPEEFVNPFMNHGKLKAGTFNRLIDNLSRYGITLHRVDQGTGSAGSIMPAREEKTIVVGAKKVKVGFHLVLNSNHPDEIQFATLAHELAHLFCGHLGNAGHAIWPSRTANAPDVNEFEAESVAWLVCERAGIRNPSEGYLSGYLGENGKAPPISLETVLRATSMVEEMTKAPVRIRKELLVGLNEKED